LRKVGAFHRSNFTVYRRVSEPMAPEVQNGFDRPEAARRSGALGWPLRFSQTVANRANENEQTRKGFENARHVWKRPTVLPSNDLL
jgi:hypothetical protein